MRVYYSNIFILPNQTTVIMMLREYKGKKDRESVHRIWREVGWMKPGKEEKVNDFVESSDRAMLAELDGNPESMVLSWKGKIAYLDNDLPLSCIASVLTSTVAKKRGLAGKLTAKCISEDAENGAAVSALGIFDQGFYNRLGFGTGTYEHWLYFDPASLEVPIPDTPERLKDKDWKEIHQSRVERKNVHGRCNIISPHYTRTELKWSDDILMLGYFKGKKISHHVVLRVENFEDGPYVVKWMSFKTREQFLELMGILKSLEDQIKIIVMREPPGIILQDFLQRPFRYRQITKKSKFENKMIATAYWQVRILDLNRCLEKTSLQGEEVRFNLKLYDPIDKILPSDSNWRGIGGKYVITLGPRSSARKGHKKSLPTLTASVGSFSRMWLGVAPATSLAMTDEMEGPRLLLEKLDRAISVPEPHTDWDF